MFPFVWRSQTHTHIHSHRIATTAPVVFHASNIPFIALLSAIEHYWKIYNIQHDPYVDVHALRHCNDILCYSFVEHVRAVHTCHGNLRTWRIEKRRTKYRRNTQTAAMRINSGKKGGWFWERKKNVARKNRKKRKNTFKERERERVRVTNETFGIKVQHFQNAEGNRMRTSKWLEA